MSVTTLPARGRSKTQEQHDQEAFERLSSMMKQPMGPSHVLEITPGLARLILEKLNTINRHMKPIKIAEFAEYMRTGQWHLTGDSIKFAASRLLDGQNRLFACSEADVPFTTHAVFGVDVDWFSMLDRGRGRSVPDAFKIEGVKYPGIAAGVVRWLEKFRLKDLHDRGGLIPSTAVAVYKQHYDKGTMMQDAIKAAQEIPDATPKSIAATLHFQFSKKNPQLAAEFFEAWATKSWSQGRFRPIKRAVDHLSALHSASNGRVHELARFKAIITAWNLVVDKRLGRDSDFVWKGPKKDTIPTIKG